MTFPPNLDLAERLARFMDGAINAGAYDPTTGVFSGGGGAGNVVVRKFPFAYNTPNILTGATLYTPTVGDVVIDLWMEIDTAWNGTTPRGDVGTFDVGHIGVFSAFLNSAYDMTSADSLFFHDLSCASQGGSWGSLALAWAAAEPTASFGGLYSVSGANVNLAATAPDLGFRLLPAKFTSALPIKVCVSQNGTNTGADPGATQGAATLYLVTATPS